MQVRTGAVPFSGLRVDNTPLRFHLIDTKAEWVEPLEEWAAGQPGAPPRVVDAPLEDAAGSMSL